MKPSELEIGNTIVFDHISGRTFTFLKEGENLIRGTIDVPAIGPFHKNWTVEIADQIYDFFVAQPSWSLVE